MSIHITDINLDTGLDRNHGTVNLVDYIVNQFSNFPNMNEHQGLDLDYRNAQFESIREHLIATDNILVQQHGGRGYKEKVG